MKKLIKQYFTFFSIFLISCNDSSSDGYPESLTLFSFDFQESKMLVKWNKSNEKKDDFYSYNFYGSNDSLMEYRKLIYESFDQSDTSYNMNNSEPFKYFQIDVVNRLTGYYPLYYNSSSNIIYFNINEWVFLWDQYYSIFTSRLDLADNQISNIPEGIVLLENLKRLDLTNNMLSGTIPDIIFELKSLEDLILTNNQLTGNIPQKIDSLNNIQTLFLNQNFLSGQIPDIFCSMGINFGNSYRFNIEDNQFCPPYPLCLESHVGEQDLSGCE